MERTNYTTGAKWESVVGYSRAVRVGPTVSVTGTVGLNPDGTAPAGIYDQSKRALEIIGEALAALGARYEDVVRTRMFVTDISQWEAVGRAHAEVFRDIKPCTTMVEVSALISPEYLVEIEADAIIAG